MASSLIRRSAGILISKITGVANRCKLGGGPRMMSSMSSDESSPTPWLMLPSSDSTAYKFYSLSEKKIVSIEKNRGEESPEDDAEVVGSSRGWLALLNRRNKMSDFFLSNPCSGKHIELPYTADLPYILSNERRIISKVILSSSSPDSEDCRVMVIYGRGNKIGLSKPNYASWTQIGNLYMDYDLYYPHHRCARVCEDMAYCPNREVMSCMTPYELDLDSFEERTGDFWCEMEHWNVHDPPILTPTSRIVPKKIGEKTHSWVEENMDLLYHQCLQIPHLVYAADRRLYIVLRFVVMMGPDGTPLDRVPHCPIRGLRGCYPCQTVGFIVLERTRVYGGRIYEVVDDLNGLAMFVGVNDSVAISVSDHCPELKPNSIYFTDAKRYRMLDGRHDAGIFNYMSKTISPIIIQADDYRIHNSPLMWFTPTPVQPI